MTNAILALAFITGFLLVFGLNLLLADIATERRQRLNDRLEEEERLRRQERARESLAHKDLYELANDGGSWLGEATNFGNTDLGVNSQTIIFEGRDGYEGLTAYAVVDWRDFAGEYVGTVFPAAMPEVPEPYVAE